MKKNILLLLLLLVALGLSACTSNNTEQDKKIDEEKEKIQSAVVSGLNILGEKFYYSDSVKFEVDGIVKEGTQIFDSGIYYASEKKFEDEYIYGVSPLTYAELYYGIVNQNEAKKMTPRKENPVQDIDVEGMYDAVTSATSKQGVNYKDYPHILNYMPADDSREEMTINGLKEIDVRVDKRTYVEAMILKDAGRDYAVIEPASKFVANEDITKPIYNNNVFTLLNDGSYSMPKSVDVGGEAISTEEVITTTTVDYHSDYGDYVVNVEFDGFEREDFNSDMYFNNYLMNLYGAVVKNNQGVVCGAVYYEDVWVEVAKYGRAQVAFSNGDVDLAKIRFINARYNDFFNADIFKPDGYSVTFLSRGYGDITADFVIREKIEDENLIMVSDAPYASEVNLPVDISKLRPDYMQRFSGEQLFKNGSSVDREEYTYNLENNTLTVKSGIGSYRLVLQNSKYESVACDFNIMSSLTNNDVSIKDGKLVIAEGRDSTVEQYVDNIYKISIADKPKNQGEDKTENEDKMEGNEIIINNLRNVLFKSDGSLDLNVKDGDDNKIFESLGEYTVTIYSYGYNNIVLTIISE